MLYVGFGTNWLDFDNDTDVDLFVANGHIIDNVRLFKDNVTYAQPNHLYRNDGGGRFAEIHDQLGEGLSLVKVSRGSAAGDLDDDGDVDIVVANNNQRADYLRNEGGHRDGHWLRLCLTGRKTNRSAAGARVLVMPVAPDSAAPSATQAAGTAPLLQEVKAGSSFGSTSDLALHFGLGAATQAEVTVRWPGGGIEKLGRLAADRIYVLVEGRGVLAQRAASTATESPAGGD